MKGIRSVLPLLLPVFLLAGCGSPGDGQADLILTGGVVWTGGDEAPRAEAVAIIGATLVQLRDPDAEIRDLIVRLKTLTPQQTRVLSMLAEGLLNKQIAYELNVSEATVKAHVSAILQKLGVDSRTQAVIRLSRIGTEPLSAEN